MEKLAQKGFLYPGERAFCLFQGQKVVSVPGTNHCASIMMILNPFGRAYVCFVGTSKGGRINEHINS
jgi:hypothetical protein